MDLLVLSFTKEQRALYDTLLNEDDVILDFDVDLPAFKNHHTCDVHLVAQSIENECAHLFEFKKYDSLFSVFMTVEEIKRFIPMYYDVIRKIESIRRRVGSDAWILSYKIEELNNICKDMYQRYTDFLPYKAALGNREKYATKIADLDVKFKQSIKKSEEEKAELMARCEQLNKLNDIIRNFFDKSSDATDSPKFKKFDAYEFFFVLEGFCAQITALKNEKQKEM